LSSYGVVVVRTPTFPDTFEYRKLAVISFVKVFVDKTLPVTRVERIGAMKVPDTDAFSGDPMALMTIEFDD
jgi:hypothetical protein